MTDAAKELGQLRHRVKMLERRSYKQLDALIMLKQRLTRAEVSLERHLQGEPPYDDCEEEAEAPLEREEGEDG